MSASQVRMQVHFGGEHGEPVAVSLARKKTGRGRVLVEVDDFEPGVSRRVYILHHARLPEIIIAASTRRDAAERVLTRRGAGARAYRLTAVPVVESVPAAASRRRREADD